MARPQEQGLTARESQLMGEIWDAGEVTIEELRVRLGRRLAGSTLRTLLSILEEKGYVRTSRRGRANVYAAIPSRERVQADALRTLAQRLFRGSASGLLQRLVEEEEISLEELDELRAKVHKGRRGT